MFSPTSVQLPWQAGWAAVTGRLHEAEQTRGYTTFHSAALFHVPHRNCIYFICDSCTSGFPAAPCCIINPYAPEEALASFHHWQMSCSTTTDSHHCSAASITIRHHYIFAVFRVSPAASAVWAHIHHPFTVLAAHVLCAETLGLMMKQKSLCKPVLKQKKKLPFSLGESFHVTGVEFRVSKLQPTNWNRSQRVLGFTSLQEMRNGSFLTWSPWPY